jgi:hypothetical protein
MQLQVIIGNGEKGHHTLVLNDAILSKVVIATSITAQVWVLMLLLSICFLAFWSSFALLQPCGQLESGIILKVMPTTSIPYTP